MIQQPAIKVSNKEIATVLGISVRAVEDALQTLTKAKLVERETEVHKFKEQYRTHRTLLLHPQEAENVGFKPWDMRCRGLINNSCITRAYLNILIHKYINNSIKVNDSYLKNNLSRDDVSQKVLTSQFIFKVPAKFKYPCHFRLVKTFQFENSNIEIIVDGGRICFHLTTTCQEIQKQFEEFSERASQLEPRNIGFNYDSREGITPYLNFFYKVMHDAMPGTWLHNYFQKLGEHREATLLPKASEKLQKHRMMYSTKKKAMEETSWEELDKRWEHMDKSEKHLLLTHMTEVIEARFHSKEKYQNREWQAIHWKKKNNIELGKVSMLKGLINHFGLMQVGAAWEEVCDQMADTKYFPSIRVLKNYIYGKVEKGLAEPVDKMEMKLGEMFLQWETADKKNKTIIFKYLIKTLEARYLVEYCGKIHFSDFPKTICLINFAGGLDKQQQLRCQFCIDKIKEWGIEEFYFKMLQKIQHVVNKELPPSFDVIKSLLNAK